jgi:hypothetical protein
MELDAYADRVACRCIHCILAVGQFACTGQVVETTAACARKVRHWDNSYLFNAP